MLFSQKQRKNRFKWKETKIINDKEKHQLLISVLEDDLEVNGPEITIKVCDKRKRY